MSARGGCQVPPRNRSQTAGLRCAVSRSSIVSRSRFDLKQQLAIQQATIVIGLLDRSARLQLCRRSFPTRVRG